MLFQWDKSNCRFPGFGWRKALHPTRNAANGKSRLPAGMASALHKSGLPRYEPATSEKHQLHDKG
jgi:hypothetical protein